MSNKTNDEKLRILRERLDQIKQKDDNSSTEINSRKENINEYTSHDSESIKKSKKTSYVSWLLTATLILAIIYGCFYAYEKINESSLNTKSVLETNTELEKESNDLVEKPIKYDLKLKGDNIAITSTFDEESSAKAMASDLELKGFRAGYFYLPNKSNSTKKVYQVFVGPYENERETNQWVPHLDLDVTIVHINDGSISRNIKSRSTIQQEKIAKEKAEIEKIAKEKAEIEKIAKEKAEKERLRNESAKLKREINELKQNRKKLLNNSSDIEIRYTYEFTNTMPDEGFITINNNAGYPQIKQLLSNIKSQGGIERIINNIKNTINKNGILIDEMFFEKQGTKVPTYKGDITIVYY